MTEEEAKTKHCCGPPALATMADAQIRTSIGQRTTTNVGCKGSACMAWRTRHEWLDNAAQKPGWVTYPPYAFEPGEGQERENGYCGLAGEIR